MKNLFLFMLLLAASKMSKGQDNPVYWHCTAKIISALTYELHFKAEIDPPYHIYAQENTGEVALPTKINIKANPLAELQGKVTEKGDLQSHKDANSGETINYFSQEVDFVQVIKLKRKTPTHIRGYIDYMACTDDHCLPEAKQVFNISVGQ